MRLVVLLSGHGSNLQAIIDSIQAGALSAQIVAVISDKADAYGLQRAQEANIPTHCISRSAYQSKTAFEAALKTCIADYQADWVVLAGFMRVLSEDFVQAFEGQMLNIHPALLPAYKGLETHARVIADGGDIHGVSVHLVTADLDSGPLIAQARCPVYPTDTPETLAQRVHILEHQLYPLVLQWLATQQIRYNGEDKKFYRDDVPLPNQGELVALSIDKE